MFTIIVCFFLSTLFCLYLLIRGVEYREEIKKLEIDNTSLRDANKNLAKIIQEEQEKTNSFEVGCG